MVCKDIAVGNTYGRGSVVQRVTPGSTATEIAIRTVAAQNSGPLEHVCWVRKGHLLGSQVLVQCLQRPNTRCW